MKQSLKRILAVSLSLLMLTGLMTPALAYDACQPVQDLTLSGDQTPDYDGRTIYYLDIYSGQQTGRPEYNSANLSQLYKDAVLNRNNYIEWVNLAYNIFASHGCSYGDDEDRGWVNGFSSRDSGYKVDFIQSMMEAYEYDGSEYDVRSTGLSHASSLQVAVEETANSVSWLLKNYSAHGGMDKEDILGQHDLLTDTSVMSNKSGPVLYANVANLDRYGATDRYAYNSFTIAFYDFQVYALDTGDELNSAVTGKTATQVQNGEVNGVSYGNTEDSTDVLAENYTLDDMSVTLTTGSSTTSTMGSSVTNSNTITNGLTLGRSLNITAKIPLLADIGVSLSGSFSFSDAISNAYTNSTSTAEQVSDGLSVTANVPPHTVLVGSKEETRVTTTIQYDCPIVVTYNVAIFSMSGNLWDGSAIDSFDGYTQRSFLTKFGDTGSGQDAPEEIYWRATMNSDDPSYDKSYGYTKATNDNGTVLCEGLDWSSILEQEAPTTGYSTDQLSAGTQMIYDLDDDYAMSVNGAAISLDETYQSISMADVNNPQAMPVYPIGSVYVNWQIEDERTMEVGDTMAINSNRVKAMDTEGASYHGFLFGQGTWKIVDASGNILTDANGKEQNTDGVAQITTDAVTGKQTLTAVAPGTSYVKYFIKETQADGSYTYVTHDGTPSLNENISSPAYKFVVSAPAAEAFDGTLVLVGSPVVTTNVTENLNTLEGLALTAYDKTGKEVVPHVSWEAQELPGKGITVDPDGAITVTTPGTFHVRAYWDNSANGVDNVYSDWVEVTAAEPVSLLLGISYHPFTDVPYTHWANDHVGFVCLNKIMNGTAATKFTPNGTTTRAMVAQVLYNLAGQPAVEGENPFVDVAADAWYADAVIWAAETGLTTGVKADRFAPNDQVTREQLVTFICRYADWAGVDLPQGDGDLSRYEDADQISAWAKDFVVRALEAGIINGKTDTTLVPGGYATRAELAAMLHRCCGSMLGNEMNIIPLPSGPVIPPLFPRGD